jgi:hypothetical protein
VAGVPVTYGLVRSKAASAFNLADDQFHLAWIDEDNEAVAIASDDDLTLARGHAHVVKGNTLRVSVILHSPVAGTDQEKRLKEKIDQLEHQVEELRNAIATGTGHQTSIGAGIDDDNAGSESPPAYTPPVQPGQQPQPLPAPGPARDRAEPHFDYHKFFNLWHGVGILKGLLVVAVKLLATNEFRFLAFEVLGAEEIDGPAVPPVSCSIPHHTPHTHTHARTHTRSLPPPSSLSSFFALSLFLSSSLSLSLSPLSAFVV